LYHNRQIESIKNGNKDAFNKLILQLEPKVSATVYGMLGFCQEAEDVGQETFVRLYKSMSQFRGEANIETYVTRIAINLSLNELKRRKRRSFLFIRQDKQELENYMSGSDDQKNQETKELVNNAISKLKAGFKSVVVLRLLNGYSVKETAKILQIPPGTVLSRLARAQIKLKEILTPQMENRHG